MSYALRVLERVLTRASYGKMPSSRYARATLLIALTNAAVRRSGIRGSRRRVLDELVIRRDHGLLEPGIDERELVDAREEARRAVRR